MCVVDSGFGCISFNSVVVFQYNIACVDFVSGVIAWCLRWLLCCLLVLILGYYLLRCVCGVMLRLVSLVGLFGFMYGW